MSPANLNNPSARFSASLSDTEKEYLNEKVLGALRVAIDAVAQARTAGPNDAPDLVWKANAYAELSIGIARLEFDDFSGRGRRKVKMQRPLRRSLGDLLTEVQNLLEQAIELRREGSYLKSLETARRARDILSARVIEDTKKERKRIRAAKGD
jgi:hypothetical protein